MPTAVKNLDNMTKHLTQAELEARAAAEAAVLPTRKVKRPARIAKDAAAKRYWDQILKDMEGVGILDTLDSNVLAIYCEKCARRDELQDYYRLIRSRWLADPETATLKLMARLDADLKGCEDAILTYASKLGLTPESRSRLAKRQAEQEEYDPDADLFAP